MDSYLKRAHEEIDQAVAGVSRDQMIRTDGRHWSIAQICEHLTLAFTLNGAAMEKALASGQLKARPPSRWQRLMRVMVVDFGYFPRVKSPEMTAPTGTIPAERSVAAVGEALVSLDRSLSRVVERFGDDVMVANHPFFAGMTVRQWRKFHWRHTRHHMKQVRARRREHPPVL